MRQRSGEFGCAIYGREMIENSCAGGGRGQRASSASAQKALMGEEKKADTVYFLSNSLCVGSLISGM